MPWIDVDEPFSAVPRTTGPLAPPGGDGVIDVDDRWGSILEADLSGEVDVARCERLELRGTKLRGVTLRAEAGLELDIANCAFIECDVSAVRFTTVTNTTFVGCKLSGVDFGNAIVRDAEFERTLIRMGTVRMAEMERVRFQACTLDDVDFAEATLRDVAFPESELRAVEFDKTTFQRVDLREAQELDLRSGRRFEGCLLTSAQVLPLAHVFAHATGIGVAKEPA